MPSIFCTCFTVRTSGYSLNMILYKSLASDSTIHLFLLCFPFRSTGSLDEWPHRNSPPPGSPRAVPIAMSVAGRKYHCPSALFHRLEVITLVFPLGSFSLAPLRAVLAYPRDRLAVSRQCRECTGSSIFGFQGPKERRFLASLSLCMNTSCFLDFTP
jgi:hypothetical protein